MSTSEKYYRERLYPFQDGILRLVKKSATPFYLTGGTALSRRLYPLRQGKLAEQQSRRLTFWNLA